MSLFQFGFTTVNSSQQSSQSGGSDSLPDYLPQASKCGLGVKKHSTVTSFVSELADPASVGKKRKTKGHYTHYSNEDRAKIGKYASENGNERAKKKFREKYPS